MSISYQVRITALFHLVSQLTGCVSSVAVQLSIENVKPSMPKCAVILFGNSSNYSPLQTTSDLLE